MIDPSLAAMAADMRSNYRALIPSAGAPDPVTEVRAQTILAAGPDRAIPVQIYIPERSSAKAKLPIILFAHGGGFVAGDFDTHDVLARAIANGAQALVVAVGYRLAPEYPFPCGLDDVYAALCWLAAHADEIGGDSSILIVCGDSAGANLVAVAAIRARDEHGPPIAAQWLMYPCVSNKLDTPSWQELGNTNFPTRGLMNLLLAAYVPSDTSPVAPQVAPLWADLRALPPTLIQVGELDPLRDENIDYANALKAAGVDAIVTVYEGQQHGFIQFYKDEASNPRGARALQDGFRFLALKMESEG